MRNERILKSDAIRIPQATAKGYVEVLPGMVFDFSYPSSTLRRGRVQGNGDICPTITTVSANLLYYERYAGQHNFSRDVDFPDCEEDGASPASKNRILSDVSQTTIISTMSGTLFPQHTEIAKQCGEGEAEESPQPRPSDYRLRKLTPREVLRLMDVYDDDIDRLFASGLSDNALYELAGNSIVVHCLYLIFRNMLISEFMARPTAPPPKQLSLFAGFD